LLRNGVLLVFAAPGQLRPLAGPKHGRTILLADMAESESRRHRSWDGRNAACDLLRHSAGW
jgi:hypothetical protein